MAAVGAPPGVVGLAGSGPLGLGRELFGFAATLLGLGSGLLGLGGPDRVEAGLEDGLLALGG